MGLTLALPLAHLPLVLVLAVVTAVAIPSWPGPTRRGWAGSVLRAGAVCRSVLGRAFLGVVAAVGLYVLSMAAGTFLIAALTRPPAVERNA